MAVSSDPLAPGNEGLIARDRGLLNFPEPEAAREAVRRIDLSGNKIRSFPNWLAELVALRELGLDENLDLRWNRLVGADEMIRKWERGGCLVYRCPRIGSPVLTQSSDQSRSSALTAQSRQASATMASSLRKPSRRSSGRAFNSSA